MNKSKILLFALFLILIAAPAISKIENRDYIISDDSINKMVRLTKFSTQDLIIENKKDVSITVQFKVIGDIEPYVDINFSKINIGPGKKAKIPIYFFGETNGDFNGNLTLFGGITEIIPLSLKVKDDGTPVSALKINIIPLQKRVYTNDELDYKINLENLLMDNTFNLTLRYSIDNMGAKSEYIVNKTFLQEEETIQLNESISLIKKFEVPEFIKPGEYVINARAEYLGTSATSSARFYVSEPFWDYLIFGIVPVRWILLITTIIILGGIAFIIIRIKISKNKRYKGKVDLKTLPKNGERSIYLGKIAETNVKAYFDLDQLTMHSVIAGSTGGGKTVSAEILVEEALQKKVGIIVFDPTAQWSGFLRKNTNKKLFTLYSKFGMKKSDAKAFNGNVHQILNARQIIDIKKFMVPGEIHVFTINRLQPKDSDFLVANTIREIFKANLPESPNLKTIIIFDEVHRLLPKFGGSGQGFLQIERGAREFRKWGVGLILISQVLTDFIGETKANLNTEFQMRTRDEGDLNRIKEKYGGYMLQSLIKSATGTGMIENSSYNNGNPYFISFRPPMHEHARLNDDELQNYNKYNEMIDDLDYEIQQLEEEGLDVFDLKLELKMALNKVKAGSFNMVDIYLEGLKPRLESNWEALGKTPKKREVNLVSEEELQKEYERAKEEEKKRDEQKKGTNSSSNTQSKVESGPKKLDLPALKLENEVTVMSPQELIDAINTMDDETYAQHVNDETNIFADWFEKADKKFADEIRKLSEKADIIAAIEDYLYK